jgi:hypothetical protein
LKERGGEKDIADQAHRSEKFFYRPVGLMMGDYTLKMQSTGQTATQAASSW